MTHASVGVQRIDGLDESLGDQNPSARECEGKRKVKKKTHLKFEQSDKWFFCNYQVTTYRKKISIGLEVKKVSQALDSLSLRCPRNNRWMCAVVLREGSGLETWEIGRFGHQQDSSDRQVSMASPGVSVQWEEKMAEDEAKQKHGFKFLLRSKNGSEPFNSLILSTWWYKISQYIKMLLKSTCWNTEN